MNAPVGTCFTPFSQATAAVVVGGDTLGQEVLTSFLHPVCKDVLHAPDGETALALVGEHPRSVVFTDWSLPGMGGLELCSRIRERVWADRPYVIMTTGRESNELWRALAAGADDVLRKPFERREVEARVARARFFKQGGPLPSLSEAVTEAICAPAGELVVRQGGVLARLMFRAGRIVWVTVTPPQGRFSDHLVKNLGLDAAAIREVLEETRVTGVPFEQILIDWKLAERDRLRDCQRTWLRANLDPVRQMAAPSALFVPLPPGGAVFEGFSVEELAPWLTQRPEPHPSIPPPSSLPGTIGHHVSMAMRVNGAAAAFALVVRDGTCLAQKGDRSHIEVAWALARALRAVPPGTASGADAVLSSATCHYVARSLENQPDVQIVVAFDVKSMTSGSARLHLARLTATA